jgi:hypothetical protein
LSTTIFWRRFAPIPIKKKQRGTCCAALLMTGGTLLCRLMPN